MLVKLFLFTVRKKDILFFSELPDTALEAIYECGPRKTEIKWHY